MFWRRPSESSPEGLHEGARITHHRKPQQWPCEWLAALGLLVSVGGGCRCSSDSPSASVAAPAAPPPPDCERSGVQLTLAPTGAAQPAEPPLDPDMEVPFATEPGMALAARAGFFATGLKHEPRGAVALLGRVGAEDAPSQLVELAHVRGDVLPPRLAGDTGDLWVVLQDGTGAGRELRVARLDSADLNAPLRWRQGPSQPNAESSAFDIAASGSAALLVYEAWSAEDNHGRIRAVPLAREATTDARLDGVPITPADSDAEAPRVVSRPGGYWLAWLVNAPAAGTGRGGTPGDEASDPAPEAYATRWLSVARLDAAGAIVGHIVRLTGKRERVVGYDLTTSPSGAAWLSWRQDAPTPGASGGRVFIAEVRQDGGRDSAVVRDADVGSGEPTWLSAGDEPTRWLTFPDARDRTLLMRVASWQRVEAPLRLGHDLDGASALAASGRQVLFAQPRGRALELLPARCGSALSNPMDAGAGAAAGAAAPAADAGAPARRKP